MTKRDLLVIVADLDAENTIKTILSKRQDALGICLEFDPSPPPNGDLLRYAGRDSGCYRDAPDLLRKLSVHNHAMVLFDLHGSGAESKDRERIEADVEERIERNGWLRSNVAAIAIEPELEVWAWARSKHVANTMGWDSMENLRGHLEERGLWGEEDAKPQDPKHAMEEAVKFKRVRGGTAPLFAKLSEQVSLQSCSDPTFNKFRETLNSWFSVNGGH